MFKICRDLVPNASLCHLRRDLTDKQKKMILGTILFLGLSGIAIVTTLALPQIDKMRWKVALGTNVGIGIILIACLIFYYRKKIFFASRHSELAAQDPSRSLAIDPEQHPQAASLQSGILPLQTQRENPQVLPENNHVSELAAQDPSRSLAIDPEQLEFGQNTEIA